MITYLAIRIIYDRSVFMLSVQFTAAAI